ncbi:FecR family protein [Rhizosphaericola mali]|uniref:FecR family protein n=1 Tax=Rhizosphaericola mali TaxID=2545455 RepID=A0A5P2G5A8_9BACT|nr:FecR family protein [Rhizosphaericola mali]QES89002.1 FecR family protein [Rhizosphaericola mali]
MDRINVLYKKYIDGTISTKELEEFWNLVRAQKDNSPFWKQVYQEYSESLDKYALFNTIDTEKILAKIFASESNSIQPKQKKSYALAYTILGACVVLVSILIFQFRKNNVAENNFYAVNQLGKGGATIQISGSQQYNIDSLFGKNVKAIFPIKAIQTNKITSLLDFKSSIQKTNNYTITTLQSRNMETILPDGSKVWLNANSKLEFPSHFNTNSRDLTIKGEAYFEVAKLTDKKGNRIPFVVHILKGNHVEGNVEVLGTHFNIKDYQEDNNITCTLFEGKIRYVSNQKILNLRPGQQIEIKNTQITTKTDTTQSAIAWKNGQFILNNEDIHSVLNEISRWYNVSIIYKNTNKIDLHLNGILDKNLPLEDILQVLKNYGLECKLENNSLYVL